MTLHGDSPARRSPLADPSRLVAFSDGVPSITIPLLAFEVTRPAYQPGRLSGALFARWPTYVAFLASFLYVGVIWLNHHATFARVRLRDRNLHRANLPVLMTVSPIPFPTAVVATALQNGDAADAGTATALYALLVGVMCFAWLVLFHNLRGRPHLLEADVDPAFFRTERLRAVAGVAGYATAGLAGWFLDPRLALLIFLILPVFYGVTSEGLTSGIGHPRRCPRPDGARGERPR